MYQQRGIEWKKSRLAHVLCIGHFPNRHSRLHEGFQTWRWLHRLHQAISWQLQKTAVGHRTSAMYASPFASFAKVAWHLIVVSIRVRAFNMGVPRSYLMFSGKNDSQYIKQMKNEDLPLAPENVKRSVCTCSGSWIIGKCGRWLPRNQSQFKLDKSESPPTQTG